MTRLPFELLLALRYLRPKRTFVSVITLISIVGVMLGVAVLIIVISVMTGFDRQFRDRILGFNAHLRIEQDSPMEDYAAVMEQVATNKLVKGVAPYVMGLVVVAAQTQEGLGRTTATYIRGIDPAYEKNVSVLLSSIRQGEADVRGKGVLIGKELAAGLRVEPGDLLAVYSVNEFERMRQSWLQNESSGEAKEAYLPTDYEVRGIFDVGFYEFNQKFIVCSLVNAQDLHSLDNHVHGLIIMLHDPYAARKARSQLQAVLGPDFHLATWEEENREILDALLVEKNVMFYLLFFIMIVAAFGITSALITFVVQKTREIGILKALGATSQQVMSIFLCQSLFVGIIGVGAGLALGMLGVAYRNEFLLFLRGATGFELFPARIYGFSELPALIVPGDISLICGGSLLACLVAGEIPAWFAGRLKPLAALRYE